jgi:hypothetical protein
MRTRAALLDSTTQELGRVQVPLGTALANGKKRTWTRPSFGAPPRPGEIKQRHEGPVEPALRRFGSGEIVQIAKGGRMPVPE